MRRLLTMNALIPALAVAISAAPLLAQQQPTLPAAAAAPVPTGKGVITGFVFDSLNHRFLAGAEVIVDGAKRTVFTDSTGKFNVDELAPGNYQVGVFDPILDTLDISLATQPFHLGPDSTSVVVFTVPSAATLVQRFCPSVKTNLGKSAVIGRVIDPETLKPIGGAEVSIAWIELTLSKEEGLHRTPHVMTDTTKADGSYHICGIPNSMEAALKARKDASVTAEIPVSVGSDDVALAARQLLLSLADSGVTTGKASVSGKVVLDGASSNAGTRVELLGSQSAVLTNEAGEFTLTNLPSGTRTLVARHLGYSVQGVTVDLSSREPQKVSLELSKFVSTMDPVLVVARRNFALDRVGFNTRKKLGNGYFLGPDRIERMHPMVLTDVLRMIPSLRVTNSGTGTTVTSSRGPTSFTGAAGCVQYYLDDSPWFAGSDEDINDFVNGSEVVAVEVYDATQTPPEYTRGMTPCTTIVVWTKFKVRS
ncbi:MAG: carboxypeptidase regulatory-like domain-containing protein [Gemmatimonadaceae bacterium]